MQHPHNPQCSVSNPQHIFPILYDKRYYVVPCIIIIILLYHKILHITDGHILWCACTFICWPEEVFTALIHMDITITLFFFLSRRAQSIFLALITICTWSLFMLIHFLVTHTWYVEAFLFISVHWSYSILNCFVYAANCFVGGFFLSASNLIPLVCSRTWFLILISFETCLIRNK